MNQHVAFLNEVRDDRSDLARVLQKHKGIRRTVEDLYPDNAHFIYELLQNAEDKGATKASFTLTQDRLVFEHNGEPFTADDVWGITDIGEGTKATDKEKIGCFGIGFKAVFAYTDSPEIYSPTFCFQIDQLVLPSELPSDSSLGKTTRFEFPFNSSKKSPQDAYDEIQTRLDELSEVTLLFLSCVEEIRWGSTVVRRIQHSETHYEVRKEISNHVVESSHFLRFSELVTGLHKQHVRLAYPLRFIKEVTSFNSKKPLHRQMQIIGAETGIVAVSFPCAKEASGLRFHLHAPFVPELSRASVKETVANEPLFEQLARLSASSLHSIRDLRLLTADFLGVMPNSKETLPERYHIFRAAIINEMDSEALTPTFNKGHAPASQLLQSKASLKLLLTKDDIRFLLDLDDDESYEWAVGASQKNSLQDHFLDSLDLRDWGADDFVEFLTTNATRYSWREPNESFLEWLNGKPDDWMQAFYAALYTEVEPTGAFAQFKSLTIVRQSDGTLGVGGESYFPSDGVQHDETLPRVAEGVYTSGKTKKQQEAAKKFLEHIGVREVGEAEEIEAILKLRYDGDEIEPKKGDLKRFVALVETEPKRASLFKDYSIFECEDGDWANASDIYLDSPFRETGLSAYYDALGDKAERYPLASNYSTIGIGKKRIAKFAEAVGVQTTLRPTMTSCTHNPSWNYLCMVPGERFTSSGMDRDFKIVRLKELLKSPSIDLARLIWRTMCDLPSSPNYLIASYRMNAANGSRNAKSQLVHTLVKCEWVPQKGGGFVKPQDASAEMLPDGFPFDSGSNWLKAVEFGCGDQKKSEERRQQQATASKLGVSIEDIEFIKCNAAEFEQFRQAMENRAARGQAIDESESRNRERRKRKLKERREKAPIKESVKKLRSVPSHSRSEIDRQALFDFYFDEEDESVFCQICLDAMPFVKRNGEDCGECVYLLTEKWADANDYELKVMTPLNLVLCPVCSEIYRDYVHKDLGKQTELFDHLTNGHDSDFVVCGSDVRRDQKGSVLHINETHLGDIRDCLLHDGNDEVDED
ncbi:sacsin N-terminal ATP-binding-like domain-containing protein [Novipirellula artificiosorum]|uniref:Sacsin/Nov domain-containing protein n=1 Tax=Novipirellula artificiosorum TaxID=2528016 RepID=A0A5C6DZ16_9BACT|nr:hypothetical protein [Novipirellula artificiosorum]TWU41888.1 hypothetical protein Poly41_01810 [Novipirellula artificiosorum]